MSRGYVGGPRKCFRRVCQKADQQAHPLAMLVLIVTFDRWQLKVVHVVVVPDQVEIDFKSEGRSQCGGGEFENVGTVIFQLRQTSSKVEIGGVVWNDHPWPRQIAKTRRCCRPFLIDGLPVRRVQS